MKNSLFLQKIDRKCEKFDDLLLRFKHFQFRVVQRCDNLVDLDKCSKMLIQLQKSVPIQPITSPLKFDGLAAKSEKDMGLYLSTKNSSSDTNAGPRSCCFQVLLVGLGQLQQQECPACCSAALICSSACCRASVASSYMSDVCSSFTFWRPLRQ